MNDNVPMEYPDQPGIQDEVPGGFMEVAKSKGAQEIQAAVVMAKRFPRNQVAAEKRILDACLRKGLAEASQYSFPRGKETVSGPSIRMAEMMAQNWGNLDFGIIELDRANGVSQMMSYCWDLETNVRQTRVFSIKHIRETKRGSYKLTDERDIYELTANQGARRLRACILASIPADIIEEALKACDKTMLGNDAKRPMKERITDMVKFFERFSVTQEHIEKYVGHPLTVDRVTETEMLNLKKICAALKDNHAHASDYFDIPKPDQQKEVPALQRAVEETLKNTPAPAGNILPPLNHQPVVNHEAGLFANNDAPKLNGEQ